MMHASTGIDSVVDAPQCGQVTTESNTSVLMPPAAIDADSGSGRLMAVQRKLRTGYGVKGPKMRYMTVSEMARACGVNVETVRYYQRCGLLEAPRRTMAGMRRYDEDTVQRLRFIRRAQLLGFSLAQIAELLQLECAIDCTRARNLAVAKLAEVRRKLADLDRVQRALASLIDACATEREPGRCPIVENLAAGGEGVLQP